MKRLTASFHYVIVFMALGCSATASLAGDDGPGLEWHGQTTYVRQFKPSFDAAYSGPKSLATNREYAYSWTSTLFIGATFVVVFVADRFLRLSRIFHIE